MTESALIEALRTATIGADLRDDTGATVAELSEAIYGNISAQARGRVSRHLRLMLDTGRIARGMRYRETIDGRRSPVAVFRLVTPAKKAKP